MTSSIALFCETRVNILFLQLYILLFLPSRRSKKEAALAGFIFYVVSGFVDWWMVDHDYNLRHTLILFSQVVTSIVFSFYYSEYKDARTLYTALNAMVLSLLSNVVGYGVYIDTGNYVVAMLIGITVQILALIVLVKMIRKKYLMGLKIFGRYWGGLCLIPFLAYVIVYVLTIWPGYPMENPFNLFVSFLVYVLLVVVHILIVDIFIRRSKYDEMVRNAAFLELYSNGLEHEVRAMTRAHERVMIIKHDTKHVYRMIEKCLDEGEIDKIKDLLVDVNKSIEQVRVPIYTDNIVVNGILEFGLASANEIGIEYDCKADIPDHLFGIDQYEFATMISNLLENAIEAASKAEEGRRKVKVRIYPVKSQLLVDVRNTHASSAILPDDDGNIDNVKGEGHGYGIKSVKAFANKYDGFYEFSKQDGVFMVKVLAGSNKF